MRCTIKQTAEPPSKSSDDKRVLVLCNLRLVLIGQYARTYLKSLSKPLRTAGYAHAQSWYMTRRLGAFIGIAIINIMHCSFDIAENLSIAPRNSAPSVGQ